MLVLTRRKNESVQIGQQVTVTVVEVRGSCVRLAIDAPREVAVHRGEVHERICAEERAAAAPAAFVTLRATGPSVAAVATS